MDSISYRKLKDKLQEYKKNFDPLFLKSIPRTPKTLWQPVLYHFQAGGKRWRPFLIRTVGKIYQLPLSATEPLEIVAELTHNWTLIHDDIEDRDALRRGRETVWKKFGIEYGINSGDAMIALSFRILRSGEKKWEKEDTLFLMEELARTIESLCEGQDLEFDFRRREGNIEISDYKKMAKRKTVLLPKFGVLGVARLGRANRKEIESLEKFCDFIFLSFQIKDDLLNLISEEGYGKEIGGDIKEGKRTIPIIHLLNNASKRERREILEILLKPRENTKKREVKKVIKLMKKYGSVEFTTLFVKKLIAKAKQSLSSFPISPEKRILEGISNWLGEERIF
jgi:geranylgeranyl diphosphate synthase type I